MIELASDPITATNGARILDTIHTLAVELQERYAGSTVSVFIAIRGLTHEQLTSAVGDLGTGTPTEALNGQWCARTRVGDAVLVTAYTGKNQQRLLEITT